MDLNPAQRAAVESEARPLCILAGAGSGKTRVLTRRIAHRIAAGQADPAHLVAVTFTRKAADELRQRLRALGIRDGVAAGTFHSLAYAQLRRHWADRGERAPALLERKGRILGPMLRARGRESAAVQPADIAGEIEWAKAQMIEPDRYVAEAGLARRTPPLPLEEVGAIYRRYEDDKRRRGVVDFDDLLRLCVRAMEEDPAFAAAQQWRFRHVFVDEFQDVNPVQFHLLSGWLGDAEQPDLCVVGDPNQAIYSWNGADAGYLLEFRHHFPSAEVVELTHNYRSTPQILTIANAILGGGRLTPTCEARGIARAVKRAHAGGTRWSEIAILTRTNAQKAELEKALRAGGVPCRSDFLQQPEIQEVLGERPSSFVAWVRDLEETVRSLDDANDRRQSLEVLQRYATDYGAEDPSPTLAGFKASLTAQLNREGGSTGGDRVDITTFHRAKGLEWPVVFVAGLERGLVPISRADTPAAEAEERRLLYVAVTRAERELHCTWASRRTFGTKPVPRQPSPWLDLIEDARARLEGRAPVTRLTQRAGLAAARARLPKAKAANQPDPPMLSALKSWRSATARAANVPAYVIFHDTTLAAVAEAMPRTEAELLALPGLGPVKTARYGEAILAVIAEHGAA